jgi:hypothetical protein
MAKCGYRLRDSVCSSCSHRANGDYCEESWSARCECAGRDKINFIEFRGEAQD